MGKGIERELFQAITSMSDCRKSKKFVFVKRNIEDNQALVRIARQWSCTLYTTSLIPMCKKDCEMMPPYCRPSPYRSVEYIVVSCRNLPPLQPKQRYTYFLPCESIMYVVWSSLANENALSSASNPVSPSILTLKKKSSTDAMLPLSHMDTLIKQ